MPPMKVPAEHNKQAQLLTVALRQVVATCSAKERSSPIEVETRDGPETFTLRIEPISVRDGVEVYPGDNPNEMAVYVPFKVRADSDLPSPGSETGRHYRGGYATDSQQALQLGSVERAALPFWKGVVARYRRTFLDVAERYFPKHQVDFASEDLDSVIVHVNLSKEEQVSTPSDLMSEMRRLAGIVESKPSKEEVLKQLEKAASYVRDPDMIPGSDEGPGNLRRMAASKWIYAKKQFKEVFGRDPKADDLPNPKHWPSPRDFDESAPKPKQERAEPEREPVMPWERHRPEPVSISEHVRQLSGMSPWRPGLNEAVEERVLVATLPKALARLVKTTSGGRYVKLVRQDAITTPDRGKGPIEDEPSWDEIDFTGAGSVTPRVYGKTIKLTQTTAVLTKKQGSCPVLYLHPTVEIEQTEAVLVEGKDPLQGLHNVNLDLMAELSNLPVKLNHLEPTELKRVAKIAQVILDDVIETSQKLRTILANMAASGHL